MKKLVPLLVIIATAAFLLIRFYLPSLDTGVVERERLNVFVSILPQKYFVEKIGGDKVDVSVLVGPGQSHSTFDPLPRDMAALANASLYFRIGVTFEQAIIDKIQELNPSLKIVDTRQGITLREIEGSSHDGHSHASGEKDPHIWLDPLLVKIQAETIFQHLSAVDGDNEEYYRENLHAFQRELDELDRDLAEVLETLPTNKLIVYHPAWGYLLDRYNIQQIPIESEGKEPGARTLTELIELARREDIKVIFLEEQYDSTTAFAIAEAVGGKVVKLDPLAEDYSANLRSIGETIKKEY